MVCTIDLILVLNINVDNYIAALDSRVSILDILLVSTLNYDRITNRMTQLIKLLSHLFKKKKNQQTQITDHKSQYNTTTCSGFRLPSDIGTTYTGDGQHE